MKKLTIMLLTVVLLLLASCSDEEISTYSGDEIISETQKQAGYMRYIENYDVEILGKFQKSKYLLTDESIGVSNFYELEFLERRGKYRHYYTTQELYDSGDSIDYYLVLNISKNEESLPVKIRVSEGTYLQIDGNKPLTTNLSFYNYKKNDNITFIKIGEYYFVVRDYNTSQPEELYLEGEWYNAFYEMPHPFYTR